MSNFHQQQRSLSTETATGDDIQSGQRIVGQTQLFTTSGSMSRAASDRGSTCSTGTPDSGLCPSSSSDRMRFTGAPSVVAADAEGAEGRFSSSALMPRSNSSQGVVNIAVRNEEGQPDYVEIDRADDEEEASVAPLTPQVRLTTTDHNSSSQAEECVRHKSITERVLKRRNSEHALQQSMRQARSRQEALVRLLNEHQKLVREVEKWSSVASMQSEGHEPSSGATGVVGNATEDENCEDDKEPTVASAANISSSSAATSAAGSSINSSYTKRS